MLKKIDNYTFVCNSRNTRSGFAHDCTLYEGDYEIATATCHYLNRTWECYTYQTVMCKAVKNAMDNIESGCLFAFKREKGYDKMTAKRKLEFEKVLEETEDYGTLKNLYDTLKNKHFL